MKVIYERQDWDGAITEIGAGQVMIPISQADHAWNDASRRAIDILRKYRDGVGLFQTPPRKRKRREY